MNTKVTSIVTVAARIFGTLMFWAAAVSVLWSSGYFSELSQIDNIVGALPVALALAFAVCGTVLLQYDFGRCPAPFALTLAACLFLCAALFPTSLTGSWWLGDGMRDVPEVLPDLSVYEPFKEGNKTAKLDGEASLRLVGDLPVMDGALALYPVYTAFAETAYTREAYEKDTGCVMFTNTVKAFNGLVAGERDVVFLAEPSQKQYEAARAAGVELCLTPIGKEAFVFLVAKSNPIDNITVRQIRNIYTNKTARWSTLGWNEGGSIVAFRRPEGSGSESGLQSVMRGYPLAAPQPLPDKSLAGEGSLMKQMSVTYRGVQPALGYSYRYFATVMYPNPDTKLLSVDGIAPTDDNIRTGAYPFTVGFYAVTRGKPTGNTKKLIDWIVSGEGQGIISKSGYTPERV